MKKEYLHIQNTPAIIWGKPSSKVYLSIHGQGGNKEESETFASIAEPCGWQVLSIDLPEHGERKGEQDLFNPWTVVPELSAVMQYAKNRWSDIALFANSIGAWFSMLSFEKEDLKSALLVSPIVDMETLIRTMMSWANVSLERLRQEKTIPTSFGQTLSYPYWEYVINNRITHWSTPTQIIYAGQDHLTDRETVIKFAKTFDCELSIWDEGEHWFHTPQQLEILYRWVKVRVQSGSLPIHFRIIGIKENEVPLPHR